MKILHKNVTLGKYNFGISVDRNIASETFEEFPDLMEMLFKTGKNGDEVDAIVTAIRNKTLNSMLSLNDQLADLVKFAMPKMVAKADEYDNTENAKKVDEILEYVKDNDVDEEFNSEIFKFICSVFTAETTEKKKPKIKFVMK